MTALNIMITLIQDHDDTFKPKEIVSTQNTLNVELCEIFLENKKSKFDQTRTDIINNLLCEIRTN